MNLMRRFSVLIVTLAALLPRASFAGCGVWASRGVPATPAAQAAVFTTFGFIAVALGGCVVMGLVLYRRSLAPRLPHHDLIEEMQTFGPEKTT